MYERFYGLSRTPFAVTPDPAMLFMSKVHREALATIIYGVETRKGFLVCTGEVGTGKSTIVRAFFDQVRQDAVKLIYIFTPQVTPFEMARYICGELGMPDPESIFAAVPRLQLKLLEIFESGRTVVLMIDEAQLLPMETLEFLRLLSNFETDTEKLIQIILVGQPEVDTLLARPDMRQVNQRVALRARLAGLGLEESFDYIEHRLRICGADNLAQVMSPSAAWLIAEMAAGIPRRINILADNALIAGFGAAQRPLGSQLAGTAVREFLGKSGAATPVTEPRFGAGRRAARRLRGALAREKGEPAEWMTAALPTDRGRTDPPRTEIIHPAQRDRGEWQMAAVDRPRPAPAPAPRVAAPRPANPAPLPRSPAAGVPQPVEPIQPVRAPASQTSEPAVVSMTGAPIPSSQTRSDGPVRLTSASVPAEILRFTDSAPIFVEPVAQPITSLGAPISLHGIVIVEPVAQAAAHETESSINGIPIVEPVAPQDTGVENPPRVARHDTEPMSPTPSAPSIARAAVLRPQSPTPSQRQTPWPALSRVRSGLQPPPPRRSAVERPG